MGKIYVVTSGEYSDYHIVAATTSKERAEKIQERYNKEKHWCDAQIEEYEDSEKTEMPLWCIYFDYGGNVYYCDSEWCGEMENVKFRNKNTSGLYNIEVCVRAKDKETAIKTAAERRAKALAEKEGL